MRGVESLLFIIYNDLWRAGSAISRNLSHGRVVKKVLVEGPAPWVGGWGREGRDEALNHLSPYVPNGRENSLSQDFHKILV
jgi:hypothetical protein